MPKLRSAREGRTAAERIRRLYAVLLTALVAALALPHAVTASQGKALLIFTTKAFGPVPGEFCTDGAFDDFGTFVTEQRIVTALPSPFGVVTHLTLKFEGQHGTFTLRVQITETPTDDPQVFDSEGVWVIVDGSGAYAALRGRGEMIGTADDAANLIDRDYSGLVHFD